MNVIIRENQHEASLWAARHIAEAIRDRKPELAYRRAFLHLKAYTDAIGVQVRYSPMIEPFWK